MVPTANVQTHGTVTAPIAAVAAATLTQNASKAKTLVYDVHHLLTHGRWAIDSRFWLLDSHTLLDSRYITVQYQDSTLSAYGNFEVPAGRGEIGTLHRFNGLHVLYSTVQYILYYSKLYLYCTAIQSSRCTILGSYNTILLGTNSELGSKKIGQKGYSKVSMAIHSPTQRFTHVFRPHKATPHTWRKRAAR